MISLSMRLGAGSVVEAVGSSGSCSVTMFASSAFAYVSWCGSSANCIAPDLKEISMTLKLYIAYYSSASAYTYTSLSIVSC